jgi:hypothetical protein
MENIMNIYRNLNSNVRIILNCIVFFAVVAVVDLPGFVWAGVIVGGIIVGAKAAYKQYVRINNMPAEAGKWVDDRINNATDNLGW